MKPVSPVGTPDTLDRDGLWLPMNARNSLGKWRSVNDYGNYYNVTPNVPAYHTGADLNLTMPKNYDADAHAPVYAILNGVVTFARRIPNSTWGNVIVIQHKRPDGMAFYSRYAHVETMQVKLDDTVTGGQMIARVGNAFGVFPYHLHFDISLHPTTLQKRPYDWPGVDRIALSANYTDPRQFILKYTDFPTPQPQGETLYVRATAGLNLRTQPSISAPRVRFVPCGTQVMATDTVTPGDGYIWRKVVLTSTQESGWLAASYRQDQYLGPKR